MRVESGFAFQQSPHSHRPGISVRIERICRYFLGRGTRGTGGGGDFCDRVVPCLAGPVLLKFPASVSAWMESRMWTC